MANYKPGQNIVKDQALRFKAQTGIKLHMNVAKTISLFGFSLLGLLFGALIMPILAPVAIFYQWGKVCVLLVKGICGKSEIREEDEMSADLSSPYKSPYLSLNSSARQMKQDRQNMSLSMCFDPKLGGVHGPDSNSSDGQNTKLLVGSLNCDK